MLNRILTDKDREKYAHLIEKMFEVIPDMMGRKYERANVQQAFAVDLFIKKYRDGNDVLCVGSDEDTSFAYLEEIGYKMTGIDPVMDGIDLHTYLQSTDELFDIVFSVSVMEHVEDDTQFVTDICKLLKSGGLAILTVDFREDYIVNTSNKPSDDYRLYTKADYDRIANIISPHNCFFVDEFTVDAEPDFVCGDNWRYGFSTMVFRKNEKQ